jgi:hypothetical protein
MMLERIEEIKFPVFVFEVRIDRVKNNLFSDATITGIVSSAHTGDLEKMVELNNAVIEARRSV